MTTLDDTTEQIASITFTDETPFFIGFDSSWKTKKVPKDAEVQTDPVKFPDKGIQSLEQTHKEVQTEEEKFTLQHVQDNSPALKQFLNNARQLIEPQLERNIRSRAFHDYSVSWEEEIHHISCLNELVPSTEFSYATSTISVTSLSWNSTGAILAVSYGRYDHTGWCTHNGMLGTWNVLRSRIQQSKPDISIETQNCLMVVEFHPTEPTIIAGGSFSGQLFVWDISLREEPLVAVSAFTADAHYESINQIVWIPKKDASSRSWNLATISGDGKIIIWTLTQKLDTTWKLEMTQGFLLALKSKSTGESYIVGGTSMSFNHEDDKTFSVGTESGRVYKCSVLDSTEKKVTFSNPINFSYEQHIGAVFGIDFSPFHRNIFITCGVDTHVRIYNMLRQKSLIDITPSNRELFCVAWSPFRPAVFATCGGDGKVYFYDLVKNRKKPTTTLDASTQKVPLQAFRFNSKLREYFATGDSKGVTKVWQLNHHLTQEQPQEQALLERMGKAGTKKQPQQKGAEKDAKEEEKEEEKPEEDDDE